MDTLVGYWKERIGYETIYRHRHDLRFLPGSCGKAVAGVPGVTGVSVSLLTNSMGVEGTASDQAIIKAVEGAGYGASVKGAAQARQGLAENWPLMKKP